MIKNNLEQKRKNLEIAKVNKLQVFGNLFTFVLNFLLFVVCIHKNNSFLAGLNGVMSLLNLIVVFFWLRKCYNR